MARQSDTREDTQLQPYNKGSESLRSTGTGRGPLLCQTRMPGLKMVVIIDKMRVCEITCPE